MKKLRITMGERILALVLSLLLVITSLPYTPVTVEAADGEVTLSGTITDTDTGLAIEAVMVSLTSTTDGAVTTETQTDANGVYSVSVTKNADYTVTFSKTGYQENVQTITVEETDIPDLNYSMTAESVVDTVKLSGTVTDALTSDVIEGVSVEVIPSATEVAESVVTTDASGVYSVDVKKNTEYKVVFTKDGYQRVEESAVSIAEQDVTLDTQMPEIVEDSSFAFIITGDQMITANRMDFKNPAASENQPDATVTYASSDISIATVGTDGAITPTGSVGTTTITATIPGTAAYKETSIEYTLTVNPAFAFTGSTAGSTVYAADEVYTLPALEGDDGTITYAITKQTTLEDAQTDISATASVAVLEESSRGELKLNRSGIVTVTATRGSDGATATYVLTVNRAQQTIVFTDGTEENGAKKVQITYGTNTTTYVNALIGGNGTGTVTYSVNAEAMEESGIAESFDTATGAVTFRDGKVGSATITATMALDDCYTECTATYVLEVVFEAMPEVTYKFSGDREDGMAEGWYTGNVMVNAPEGYRISTSGSFGNSNVWSEQIAYTDGMSIYLRKVENAGTSSETLTGITTASAVIAPNVDVMVPTVAIELFQVVDSNEVSVENGIESGNPIKAKVTVTDDNFSSVTATVGQFVSEEWTEESDGVYVNTLIYNADGNYNLKVKATDLAAREGESTEYTFTVDQTAPANLEISYSESILDKLVGTITHKYYQSEVEVTLAATDNLTGVESFSWTYTRENGASVTNLETVNGSAAAADIEYKNGVYRYTFRLPADEVEQLHGNISFTATDKTGNSATFTSDGYVVVVDNIAPQFDVAYKVPEKTENQIYYYNEDITTTFTVTEANFYPEDVKITVYKNGSAVNKNWNTTWTQNGDVWTNPIVFTEDGEYRIEVEYQDRSGNDLYQVGAATNPVTKYTSNKMVRDTTKPTDLTISYSDCEGNPIGNYRYYKSDVEVTIRAKDDMTDIEGFTWTYAKENSASASTLASKTGTVGVDDIRKNGDTYSYSFKLSASEAEQFRGSVKFTATDKLGNTQNFNGDGKILVVDNMAPEYTVTYTDALVEEGAFCYYAGDVQVAIELKEANFYSGEVTVTIIKNGTSEEWDGAWTKKSGAADTWVNNITFSGDGEYQIRVTYTDRSGNVAKYSDNMGKNGQGTYNSNKLVIDTVTPETSISLLNQNGETATYISHENCFAGDIVARLFVNDVNFAAENTIVSVNGEAVAANGLRWREIAENNWQCDVVLTEDSYYTLKIVAGDKVNKTKTAESQFIVDKTAPGAERITFEYSDELNSWEKVINAVTFGYYAYARNVDVTITATDDVAGIDYFSWSYAKEAETSSINVPELTGVIYPTEYSNDGKTAVTSFTLTAEEARQFRGSLSVDVVDRAGNHSQKNENRRINIVDNIAPNRVVSYTPAKQVVDASTLLTKAEYLYEAEGTNSILYYDGDVVATFRIGEANFYAEDVVIKVNGQQREVTDWQQNGDEWIGNLQISGDGDYIVTMSYRDRSNNTMQEYRSEKIVIDTVVPIINVVYANQNVQNFVEGVNYYNDVQTATISITDRNFRADDVVAVVTAKDAADGDVAVSDYAQMFKERQNWTTVGDVHTITVPYSVDANYVFDIDYCDLALHNMADYPEDKFTVDRTAPQNLELTYREAIQEEILESITFGFYNEQTTVTISAEDETSGVHEIVYSLLRGRDASSINSEVTDAQLTGDEIQRSGKRATADIQVPSGQLGGDNQFNGTVDCTVVDYAENTTRLEGDKRVVVDNIAPTIEVTFNDPVQEANEISYYDGDVTVDMQITEANFYQEDVEIVVTRDGAEVSVSPEWTDQDTDVHLGTFTLHEDGDYQITINYIDRSSNEMEAYESEQLTIDTEEPVIRVSDIMANQASKEEVIGFSITAEDVNFDVDSFNAVLTAVVLDENGRFMTKEISLGAPGSSQGGEVYTYNVSNLEEDAIYTLTCEVTDMAEHTLSTFTLDDGSEHESVQFSVNRNGSTFRMDDYTASVVDEYYVYEMEEDVVLQEINVDQVEIFTVRMNGEILTEGTDYETTISGGEGQWSQRDYVIDKNLFAEEGEYSIVIESTDKTETVAYSDVKNAAIAFVVDKSAPIVAISGLERDARYQVEEQVVTVMPTDEGGKLNSFMALVLDSEGNPIKDSSGNDISQRVALSGEELTTYLLENDGKITFTIPEGLNSKVRIICSDCAVHADGSTNEYNELFENVTVSQSEMIMLYANKPLFYGICIGVAGLGAAAVFGVFRVRKKKQVKQ